MKTRNSYHPSRKQPGAGFSLVEMIIAMAILSVILLILASSLDLSMRLWGRGEQRSKTFQNARASIELFAREMTPAIVDSRMQFAILPGTVMADRFGLEHIVAKAPVAIWMAPLGDSNRLHCVGYFLSRDLEQKRYRLKRILVPPTDPKDLESVHPAYPRMGDCSSSTNAEWFFKNWKAQFLKDDDPANDEAIARTVADGIVAMWIQCYDRLGNPIPWISESEIHPESQLIYNSSGYFYAATSEPFDDGATFQYAARGEESPFAMKANRAPAAVEIRIHTLGLEELRRGIEVPAMENVMRGDTLDLEASSQQFEDALHEAGALRPEVFSLRFKLINGG